MTEQTENTTKDTTSSVQAGDLTKLLEACREEAGMDIQTASTNMRLSLNLLKTLEAEDFDNLPEPPYVRGYLRSYAKLSDTDAKPLIRTYELLRGADPEAITRDYTLPIATRSKPAFSADMLRIAFFAGLIALVVLIGMIPAVQGWVGGIWTAFSEPVNPPEINQPLNLNADNNQPNNSDNEKTQIVVSKPQVSTASTEVEPKEDNPPIPQVSQQTPSQKQEIVIAQAKASHAAAVEKAKAAQQAQEEQQAIASGIDPNKKPEDETTEADAENTEKNAEDSEKPALTQPIEGEVSIRLEFNKEVWMNIRQGERKNRGKRIFEALNQANTVKELKAVTPINFKIGNAQGVTVYLNGQPYDLKPHTRGSVARFVIK